MAVFNPWIYFDLCCLGRQFDDLSQSRIKMEFDAIDSILRSVIAGDVYWIGSDILEIENDENPDLIKRAKISKMFALQTEKVILAERDFERAFELRDAGFGNFDAYHLAAAENGKCDVLLTTDDRLLKLAARTSGIKLRVINPLDWQLERLSK